MKTVLVLSLFVFVWASSDRFEDVALVQETTLLTQKSAESELAPNAKIANFSPKDGLTCNEGPYEAMAGLLEKLRTSPQNALYAESELNKGMCKDRGFTE